MGCCVSTENKPPSTSQKQLHQQHFHAGSAESSKPDSTHESRAPPPVPEETVKEVLSETPKLKAPSLPPPEPTVKKTHLQHDQKIHIQLPFLEEKIPEQNKDKNEEESMLSDQQDVSEVCSLSLSESVSTTTVTNDRRDYYDDEDEGEVKQRVTMRSPSPKWVQKNRGFPGDLGPKQGRVVGKSPTRRSEQSPKKRNINAGGSGGSGGGVRIVQSREPGVGRRAVLGSDPNKRDPGESSRRRSRSPASNRSVIGRSPSSNRRINMSPGRVGKEPPQNGGGGSNMKTAGSPEPKWASTTNNSSTTSESLENPLVSLECFIFL